MSMKMNLTSYRTKNTNLDLINKPLPIYKNNEQPINNLVIIKNKNINSNMNHVNYDIEKQIKKNSELKTTNNVYNMINLIQNVNSCDSCGK